MLVTVNGIEKYLEEVKQAINAGRYRVEMNDKRQDNQDLFFNYVINEEQRKQILLSLTPMDFSEIRRNDHKGFEHELLYVFGKDVNLLRRFGSGEEKDMAKERKYDFCTYCRDERSYTLREKIVKKEIKGKIYNFKIQVAICDECGEEMSIPGLLDFNVKAIDEQYRCAEGLVSVEDINRIMAIYNIGKAPLSMALGFGEITITRYLSGQIPSKKYSDVIKKVLYRPDYMIKLLNNNADKIGKAAYKRAMKAAENIKDMFCMSDKMLLTISYVFEQMQEVTPLALQKILYFIQGIYMVMFDKPFYKEDCMAWVHGPVYEDVYNLFKDFKYNPIEDNRFAIVKNRFEELDDDEKRVIDLVINTFGNYSGKVLENITHNEDPWKNARNDYEPLQPSRKIISKEEIKTYFSHVANSYGVDSEEKLNNYIQSYL